MTPGLRKFVLAVHLTVSVGWIGAVVAYLAVGVSAVTSDHALWGSDSRECGSCQKESPWKRSMRGTFQDGERRCDSSEAHHYLLGVMDVLFRS